jgi:hypothetical protein
VLCDRLARSLFERGVVGLEKHDVKRSLHLRRTVTGSTLDRLARMASGERWATFVP